MVFKHKIELLLITCSFALLSCHGKSSNNIIHWKINQQLIIVIAKGWNEHSGKLWKFEYSNNQWHQIGNYIEISLGKNGLAWGRGLQPIQYDGNYKKEGDKRTPAGLFKIGYAFGYKNYAQTKLSFKVMNKNHYCVDDYSSPFYNQIINRDDFNFDKTLNSTEPMRRDIYFKNDQLYKLGFIIIHNEENKPAYGSCIFTHLRFKKNATTSGCIALDEQNMKNLLNWLDIHKHPIIVILPLSSYQEKQQNWNLPTFHYEIINISNRNG